MSNYNIYFSPTSGTKAIADYLSSELFKQSETIDLTKSISAKLFLEEDICLISIPSYGGRVPSIVIERLKMFKSNHTKAILTCVYGNRAYEDTLSELQDTLESLGFRVMAGISAVARHSLFTEVARDRPNDNDRKELKEFAGLIKEKIAKNKYEPLVLKGSHYEYKGYKGGTFIPYKDDQCIECGLCIKECPVPCIDNHYNSDKDKCISCMRCIHNCPVQARHLDHQLVDTLSKKMEHLFIDYKENELFI